MTFAYGKKAPRIFENFDLELRLGERVALLGANGSGKSTLLHLIAGARRPLSGAVRWRSPQGRPGLVLQQPDLMLIQETVDAEVGFAPEQAGLSPAERDRRVAENLERLDLEGLRAEAPFSLSRGQRLRTAVASVLSMNPGVLLLDEPTAGQDRDQIDRMMRALAERFALVVFCTHDLDAAARFANRVLVLHEGRVAVDASPHAALADDATLEKASLLPTAVQRYARRLGLDALTVDETFAALHGTP